MYLGRNQEFQFYAIEVRHTAPQKLERLAKACEAVEKDVWNACEDFSVYLKKQSALVYAKKDDEIVGFALFDIHLMGNHLLVAVNECMVLRRCQGAGLPSIFSAILTWHIRKSNRLLGKHKKYDAVVILSSTVNFKIMKGFQRYDWLADKSSFRPDKEIKEVAKQYIQKENLELLTAENLFFLKAAFPNAVKTNSSEDKPAFVPSEFMSSRGDAYLYVAKLKKLWIFHLMSRWVLWKHGFRFSKRIIPLSRMAREGIIYSRTNE